MLLSIKVLNARNVTNLNEYNGVIRDRIMPRFHLISFAAAIMFAIAGGNLAYGANIKPDARGAIAPASDTVLVRGGARGVHRSGAVAVRGPRGGRAVRVHSSTRVAVHRRQRCRTRPSSRRSRCSARPAWRRGGRRAWSSSRWFALRRRRLVRNGATLLGRLVGLWRRLLLADDRHRLRLDLPVARCAIV